MDSTDSLRALAPKWSLAGDDLLLNLLQSTHQKIVSKCQELNTNLEEMASALDDASISLQNVNNKFMALSNSQFIESRVYDDDTDVTTDKLPQQEPSKTETIDEVTLLKQSLTILDNAHETAEIVDDSDTDDSDAEISVVLKPKDAYAHRPLPYIIGSHNWKNKWHAGLVIEDSDTDSSTSRHDGREVEEYSSDEELRTDIHQPDNTISEGSSSFHSMRGKDQMPPVSASSPEPQLSPADVAAELARRLGQAKPTPKVEADEEDYYPPVNTTKAVYKPQKPVSSTIFSDEPPPIDAYDRDSESQEEDDIFAEINKKQPYNSSSTAQNNMADDLFGFVPYDKNEFSENKKRNETNVAKQKSTIFDDESEPELFAEKQVPEYNNDTHKSVENDDISTKKPVGGISLFGSNKGNEIGAAILKRNLRISTSSDDESQNDVGINNLVKTHPDAAKHENIIKEDDTSKQKDIFDSLFAKSERKEQKIEKPTKEKPKQIVKDLFSDNIFDDIDDIFTSNIKIPTKEAIKNAKSIFDDDDLFSDVAKKPEIKIVTKDSSSKATKKNIFGSDDELFSDVQAKNEPTNNKINEIDQDKVPGERHSQLSHNIERESDTSDRKEKGNEPGILNENKTLKVESKSKSIFDSDDDELFSDVKIKISQQVETKSTTEDTDILSNVGTSKVSILKTSEPKVFRSPSLFEEDEIDDLFINANKVKTDNKNMETKTENKNIATKPENKNNGNVTEYKSANNDKIPKMASGIFEENKIEDFRQISGIVEAESSKYDGKVFNDDLVTIPKVTDTRYVKDDPINIVEKSHMNKQSKNDSIDVNVESKLQQHNTKEKLNSEMEVVENKNEALTSKPQEPIFNEGIKSPTDLYSSNIFDEMPVKEKQEVIPEQQKPISDVFDDMFREPPAFEKTKETKKIANVNALFEDDSDDEALFFKKNDVISDEKPEIFSPSANFGLFDDEPPALDADFSPKQSVNDFDGDDLFSSVPERKDTQSIINKPPEFDHYDDAIKIPAQTKNRLLDDDGIFSSPEVTDILPKNQQSIRKISKEILNSDEELFAKGPSQKEPQNEEQPNITKDIFSESKKIGKINTKNFNINVQALVPGASPKKTTKDWSDEDKSASVNDSNYKFEDTETVKNINSKIEKDFENPVKSIKITNKDNDSKTEVDGEVTKSISFETKPESEVLDNNLSKQRAKIQVKRRPSSRRARHEAVRKSVIDIDDDTDNSSSFDEPRTDTKKDIRTKIDGEIKHENKRIEGEIKKVEEPTKKIDDSIQAEKQDFNKSNSGKVVSDEKVAKDLKKVSDTDDFGDNNEDLQKSPQSTTKVVYILNDEDIFSNKTVHQHDIFKTTKGDDIFHTDDVDGLLQTTKPDTKTNKSNDEDDIFKSVPDDIFKTSGITTIGNTYKEKPIDTKKAESSINKQEQTKETDSLQVTKNIKSLFDLSDDEDELFGKSKLTKKIVTKSKLFDSDSEDDLFGKEKVRERQHKREKEISLKKGLFGDEDDELFVKTKPTESKASSSKQNAAKSSEIVFDDPLSMLEDE